MSEGVALPTAEDERAELEAQAARFAALPARCRAHRILSTLPFTKLALWTDSVDTLPPQGAAWRHIVALLRASPRYDLVLLTGGERVDLAYLAIAGLVPWIRTPHVIVDAHWQQGRGLFHLAQRLLLRLGRRLAREVQPHSVEEVEVYHRAFGIPKAVLRPIPWSPSLTGHDTAPARADEPGGFVLTGGLSFRDYDTLFAAMRGLDIRLAVGLPRGEASARIAAAWKDAPGLEFHTDWSNAQFIRRMAGCRYFVLPIEAGLTRCTADQTILGAMHFGKVVVATDSIGSRAYIRHGENGFLVPERSVEGWRAALRAVEAMPDDEREAIGRRAAWDARVRFNEPLRLARTLESALALLERPADGPRGPR